MLISDNPIWPGYSSRAMAKQVWQVTGKGTDGQGMTITVATSTRESAIALAAKNGVLNGNAVPVQPALPDGHLPDDEAFPPVTIERISFGATVKIGIGVFVGGLLAAITVWMTLFGLGMIAR